MGHPQTPSMHIYFDRDRLRVPARRYLPTRSVGKGIEDRRTWGSRRNPAQRLSATAPLWFFQVSPAALGSVGVISNPRAAERRRPWGLGAGARRVRGVPKGIP